MGISVGAEEKPDVVGVLTAMREFWSRWGEFFFCEEHPLVSDVFPLGKDPVYDDGKGMAVGEGG